MIRIGIICPSEIAYRRFLPALLKIKERIIFSGIAIASPIEWFGELSHITNEAIEEQQNSELAKANQFIKQYGGKIYSSYEDIIKSSEIDALYIPLPPSLHYKWSKAALENGKHVFVEKPSTTSLADTDSLIEIASNRGLAFHENYMFIYHDQLRAIQDVVAAGEIGDLRLYRISFGFPLRQLNDFRYKKSLGGGALLDAGGYCLKYADFLLGTTARVVTACANYIDDFEVDMFGSATMVNDDGIIAQIAFGMDNDYRCEIEIWGSKGTIVSNRILTAPTDFIPTYTIKKNQDIEIKNLPADDAFLKSIEYFVECIDNVDMRNDEYQIIHRQELLVEKFKEYSTI